MEERNYQDDLLHIRSMMERSSRFISLNGLSGVFAGSYALAGAFYTYRYLHSINLYGEVTERYGSHSRVILFDEVTFHLLGVAFLVLVLAIVTGFLFTLRKSRKNNVPIWDATTRRLLFNFAVPLFAGGVFCIGLLYHHSVGYLAPATLIFYGIALFNAGNFTYPDIKYLGVCEIILGLISMFFIGYGLCFWAVGFGVLHIIYGLLMYMKYK